MIGLAGSHSERKDVFKPLITDRPQSGSGLISDADMDKNTSKKQTHRVKKQFPSPAHHTAVKEVRDSLRQRVGYPSNLAKSSEMNALTARNFEEEKEEDSAAGKLSIISTNNLQDMESALMVEDGSISGQ